MAKAINVRLDAEAASALRSIERLDGLTTSEAVRVALVEARAKRFSDEVVREAARQMWNDPAYVKEVEELAALQDDVWERIPE